MLSFIFWDPSKEMFSFILPFLGRPILWYGFFFALGFFLGYFLLVYLLGRYFLYHPFITKQEILDEKKVKFFLLSKGCKGMGDVVEMCRSFFVSGDPLENRYVLDRALKGAVTPLRNRAKTLAEKALIYAVIGAVIGARLGDVIFYQDWNLICKDPLSIIRIWEGGLASHGGTVGALIALAIFAKKEHDRMPTLSFIGFLDFVCLPSAIVGGFIRIGNFFNQEIIGTPTLLPWGVVFGHPADGSIPCPRHPVQLYESLFYFGMALILFIGRKYTIGGREGSTVGLFLFFLFSFRLGIEFFKTEQSSIIAGDSILTMGQYLSLPFILLGVFLFLKGRKKYKGML